jgi:hypothetical protein
VRRNINVAARYHKLVMSLIDGRLARRTGKSMTLV